MAKQRCDEYLSDSGWAEALVDMSFGEDPFASVEDGNDKKARLRARKTKVLDEAARKPYWGIILRIPKAIVHRAQALLGMPEMEATWFVARRYTDVELPESIDGMADNLYVSRSLDFASQTVLLSITSTTERKGMYAIAPGNEYPQKQVR